MSRRSERNELLNEISALHRRINVDGVYVRELFNRVSKLEHQLAPRCKCCNQVLPKDNQ